MPAFRLFAKLCVYYGAIAAILAIALWLFPSLTDYMPVGRAQHLITQTNSLKPGEAVQLVHLKTLGGTLLWLGTALAGALLTSLPVGWVYMNIRNPEHYDQSLVGTIVMLPLVITSIVVIVQDSLALSFSLAGIAAAVNFRNSMKSSGDMLFTLLAIAIGLAAGIGAMELAILTSVAFNLCFLVLWISEFGERRMMKRYLSDIDAIEEEMTTEIDVTTVSMTTMVVKEESAAHAAQRKAEKKEEAADDDD